MLTISKVEAVNRILQALDGTIISTLTGPQKDSVLQAIRAIDTSTEKVQLENEWTFNFDGPRRLTVNGDGEIDVPSDYIYIKFRQWTNGSVWNLTVKSGKVWNAKDGTHQITGTVEIEGARKFSYEECPAAIQNYIIEKAKYEFLGLHMNLSAPRMAIYAQEMRDAYNAAAKWDSQQRFGVIGVSPNIRDVFRAGGNSRGWWWGN